MQIPLQITFHGIPHSDAVEAKIREKVGKPDRCFIRMLWAAGLRWKQSTTIIKAINTIFALTSPRPAQRVGH